MAQDLNTLLQAFTELNQASREQGKLTPAQLETEVRRLTGELQRALASLTTQLKSGDTPESAYMVEVFQNQVRSIIEQSGLKPEQVIEEGEETEKLSQDVERLKRGPVRT
jgi:cell division septum initiation protein DivIVA